MPLTLREEKGSALTHEEMDANFEYLESISGGHEGAVRIFGTDMYLVKLGECSEGFSDGPASYDADTVAVITVSGQIYKVGDGNSVDDGYGNLVSNKIDVSTVLVVRRSDDGYGNKTLTVMVDTEGGNPFVVSGGNADIFIEDGEFSVLIDPAYVGGFKSVADLEMSVVLTDTQYDDITVQPGYVQNNGSSDQLQQAS